MPANRARIDVFYSGTGAEKDQPGYIVMDTLTDCLVLYTHNRKIADYWAKQINNYTGTDSFKIPVTSLI